MTLRQLFKIAVGNIIKISIFVGNATLIAISGYRVHTPADFALCIALTAGIILNIVRTVLIIRGKFNKTILPDCQLFIVWSLIIAIGFIPITWALYPFGGVTIVSATWFKENQYAICMLVPFIQVFVGSYAITGTFKDAWSSHERDL